MMDTFLSYHGKCGVKQKFYLTKRVASQQGLKALETSTSRKELHTEDEKVWFPSSIDLPARSWCVATNQQNNHCSFCPFFSCLNTTSICIRILYKSFWTNQSNFERFFRMAKITFYIFQLNSLMSKTIHSRSVFFSFMYITVIEFQYW